MRRFLMGAALAGVAALPAAIHADVTINFDGGIFRTAGGAQKAPDSTLLILAVSTVDSTFGGPTATDFVTGDDIELRRWFLAEAPPFEPGFTGPLAFNFTSAQIASIPNLSSGDPLTLYWFPTLTTSATSPGPNTSYGSYRTDIAENASIAWFFPNDGTYTLNFHTSDSIVGQGGPGIPPSTLSPTLGYANNVTPVPEPATYAMIAGVGCLAFGAWARRSRNR